MSKHGKFLAGLGAGAVLGLLFAPKTGEESRKVLKAKCEELLKKAKELDIEEVKENITDKVTELQNEIRELDGEKVKEIAIKKAKSIKSKSEELVKLAVDKGTPAVQKAAKNVRNAAANTLKNLSEKVEVKEVKNK